MTTFASEDTPLDIPDQGTVESTINVPDVLTVGDINVTVDISHTRDQDLDVFLVAPDGTQVELFTDVGGNGDNFEGATLDDQAIASITVGSAPFSGSYQPEGSLADLQGRPVNGNWTLRVTDDKRREVGTLNGWSMDISLTRMPNDPLFADQWALNNTGQTGGTWDADIDAAEAWATTTGSMSPIVAVIDTGVDYTHEDLYLNIWLNEGEIPPGLASSVLDIDGDGLITFRDLNAPDNSTLVTDLNGTGYIDGGDLLADAAWADGTDTDGNGYVDDLIGWDTVEDDNDPMPSVSNHGSLVAGILGAASDNGVGMTGVSWQVRVMCMTYKITLSGGVVTDAAEALDYAVLMGATISHLSWGWGEHSQEMYDAIERAGAADTLFVTTAGNQSTDLDLPSFSRYPAEWDLDNIITVAAADKNNELASFSNWGLTSVDLAAPSPEIMSPQLGNSYGLGGGTSSAGPHVTGVAALLRSLHPDWTATQIKDRILSTVDLLPSLEGTTVSGGRLNAAAALAPPSMSITIGDVSVTEGDTGTMDAVFTVTRSGTTADTVTVQFATADGTATADSDYVATSGTLTFLPGETTQTITVQVNGDLAPETDETFFVNLFNAVGANIDDGQGVGTIVDDDASGLPSDMYVWDITFDTLVKPNGTDLRVLVTVHNDSNANGVADDGDAELAGATVTVAVRDENGDLVADPFTGTTDADGVFTGAWMKRVADGGYVAEVTSLSLGGYTWDHSLDPVLANGDTDLDADDLPEQYFVLGATSMAAGAQSTLAASEPSRPAGTTASPNGGNSGPITVDGMHAGQALDPVADPAANDPTEGPAVIDPSSADEAFIEFDLDPLDEDLLKDLVDQS